MRVKKLSRELNTITHETLDCIEGDGKVGCVNWNCVGVIIEIEHASHKIPTLVFILASKKSVNNLIVGFLEAIKVSRDTSQQYQKATLKMGRSCGVMVLNPFMGAQKCRQTSSYRPTRSQLPE